MHVAVHGGAGTVPEEPEPRQSAVDDAATGAVDAKTPRGAVCAAIRRLESDQRFNAGIGGAVQSDGVVRTDAGLMTGDESVGAAGAMPGVEHAVDVARVVADETPHVLVVGDGAVDLATAFDVATDRELLTAENRKRFDAAESPTDDGMAERLEWIRANFGGTDTVGAVATDGEALAAATSTAGRWFALAGRVGDVPQIGAGFYATNDAAVSATGEGEAIARYGLARAVASAIGDGDDPQTATERVIRGFAADTGGRAGVVAIDDAGRTGTAFCSDVMQTARAER